jgi:hypothetical protein
LYTVQLAKAAIARRTRPPNAPTNFDAVTLRVSTITNLIKLAGNHHAHRLALGPFNLYSLLHTARRSFSVSLSVSLQ